MRGQGRVLHMRRTLGQSWDPRGFPFGKGFRLPSSALSSSGLAPRAEGLQAPRMTAETAARSSLPLLVRIPRGLSAAAGRPSPYRQRPPAWPVFCLE